jgi:hypothetical protein
MLKIYDKQDDIPEGLRAEYKQSGTKWVPDLSDDHPVLVLSKTLKQEKEVEEAKVKKLRSDLDDALEASKTSGVPRGQALVAKADAEALTGYKALGTVDEVTAKLTEHGTLKADLDKRKRDDSLRQASKALGFNEEAFIRLPNLPEFVSKPAKDGKTVEWFVQLKDDKGVVTEKPAKEFIESSPDITPFLPSLKVANKQVEVPGGQMSTTPAPGDPFAWAKDYAKNYVEQSQPIADPFKAFNERQSA